MSATFTRLVDGEVLSTSVTTGYTVDTGLITQIHKMSFTNTAGARVPVTVYLVPAGETASDTYIIADAHSVDGMKTWSCPDVEGQVLNAGDTIQWKAASANSITAIASGVEITA